MVMMIRSAMRMRMPWFVPVSQNCGTGEVHRQTENSDPDCFIKVNRQRLKKPVYRLARHQQRDNREHNCAGKTTEHAKEAGELAGAVRKNITEWEARAQAALSTLRANSMVEGNKIAAIGYCLGGSTALQLAYSGADFSAAVSFHGALIIPEDKQTKAVKAKILICHGALDSFIPEDVCQKTRAALDKGHVDYEMIYYAGAQHSFTNPGADQKGLKGMAYNAAADRRSWAAMTELFGEVFGKAGKGK